MELTIKLRTDDNLTAANMYTDETNLFFKMEAPDIPKAESEIEFRATPAESKFLMAFLNLVLLRR